MPFETFIQISTLLATVTLAISGVVQAARSQMDFFGALVLACVCALGGGSLRDLLIGAAPVFWVGDLRYLATILPTAIGAIFIAHFIPTGKGIRLRILDIADAGGLALFAILGAQKTLELGISEPVAVMMGVITGTAGGMIRDVLSQTVPLVMRGEVYASAAIIGIVVYTMLRMYFGEVLSMLVGMSIIILIRLIALRYRLNVPRLKFVDSESKNP